MIGRATLLVNAGEPLEPARGGVGSLPREERRWAGGIDTGTHAGGRLRNRRAPRRRHGGRRRGRRVARKLYLALGDSIAYGGGCGWLKAGGILHNTFRGPQLTAALSFLRAHPGRVDPITLTLWGNDVLPLSEKRSAAPRAIAAFASRFAAIVKQLRAAAPSARIIVTGAWDPEVNRLAQTDRLSRTLDADIRRVAAASNARTANMFSALNGTGSVKTQEARLCRLTFACSKHDPHPTDAGYRAMAAAFWAASGFARNP
jgi:lysophospholipase L1-like esterase